MTWASGGLQNQNAAGNLVYAQKINTMLMAEKGNKVLTDCEVTEQGPPDLTVQVAAGTVIANGIVVAVSAIDPFSGTPVTFATSQAALTVGQSQFVFIHVDSSGVITNTEGTAAASGQQMPPEVPEDEVLLAMITLTFGDTTIDTVDIEDWRQFAPDGLIIGNHTGTPTLTIAKSNTGTGSIDFSVEDETVRGRIRSDDAEILHIETLISNADINITPFGTGIIKLNKNTSLAGNLSMLVDNLQIQLGAGTDLILVHDGANSYVRNRLIGSLIIDQDVAAGAILNQLGGSFKIQDSDDTLADLFDLDTTARTLDIGKVADTVDATVNGALAAGDFTSGLNDQTIANDPGLVAPGSINQWDDQANQWQVLPHASSSVPNPTVVYLDQTIALSISKIELTVSETTFVITGGGNFTAHWYYSIDGGTSFVLGGTSASLTSSDTTTAYDSLTAEFDGDTATDDILVVTTVIKNSGTTTWYDIDSGGFSCSYGAKLQVN